MKEKTIVLLSGGLDSATTLYLAKKRGFKCHCLIFNYGQKHKRELDSAKKIARSANCKYSVLKIDLPWKGSSLIDKFSKIPDKRPFKKMSSSIPTTYVPSRNTIFLSYAASFAEAIGANKIFIGANAIDFSGYPDCRPAYFNSFNNTIRLGTKIKDIKILTPLINKSKSQIVKMGRALGVPFALTWSCYKGKAKPCGVCDSCKLRHKGFEGAGRKDPLLQ